MTIARGDILRVEPLDEGGGFAFAGTLDLATEPEARRAVMSSVRPGDSLTFDLSGLEFMDSTGLALIVDSLETLGDRGHLALRVPEGIIDRLLEVAGLRDRPNLTLLRA